MIYIGNINYAQMEITVAEQEFTTEQVAGRFGIEPISLLSYLSRHPDLRPRRSWANGFIWTEEEIEALWSHRLRPISRGPNSPKALAKKKQGGQGS